MHNSHSLYNSTLNASTASTGIGTVSHVDLLTYLHIRSDGECVRGRSTRPSADPRPGPVHLARARAASSSTFKFTQARSADSARRPTLYFNAIFFPCPPARSCCMPIVPHCCMPVAPPALDCPCADRDLPHPVPVTSVCWPNSSRRTGPTHQSPLSSARSACSPPGRGGKHRNDMLPLALF
jgi:hypothetical protein